MNEELAKAASEEAAKTIKAKLGELGRLMNMLSAI